MTAVEVGWSLFEIGAEGILHGVALRVAADIVDGFRQGVRAEERKAVPRLDFDLGLQGLVTGEPTVLHGKDISQPRRVGPPRLNVPRTGRRAVDRPRELHLGPFAG